VNGLGPVCGLSLTAAANVRRLRRRRGWSQYRLAREAGLGRALVSLLEGGHRNFTMPVLEKAAAALGVPAGDLLADPDSGEGR
jgi:transcriptional regulator with XRE-family HTH domain